MTILKSNRAKELYDTLMKDVNAQHQGMLDSIPADYSFADRLALHFHLAQFILEQTRKSYETAITMDLEIAKAAVAVEATVHVINNRKE